MQDRLKSFLKNVKLNESLLSMVLGVVTIVIVGLLVFNFWQENQTEDIAETGESDIEISETIGEVPVIEKEDGMKYAADLPETYTVKEGDNLWEIAQSNYGSGYNWVDIVEANDIDNPDVLIVGQELKLPEVPVIVVEKPADPAYTLKPGQTVIEESQYTVQEGDTLWDISVRAYQDGYRWPELAEANDLANPGYIEVGQVLEIPRK